MINVNAAMVAVIEQAGADVLTEAEFFRSRLIRHEVRRQVRVIAETLGGFTPEQRCLLPEIDWDGWVGTVGQLRSPEDDDARLWFAVSVLIPGTLIWLRVYRQEQPGLCDAG